MSKKNICFETRKMLLYKYYKNLATQIFVWEGLPIGIESRHIEEFLFEYSQVAFYKHKDYGLICLPCSYSGELNIYGDPTELFVFSLNGKITETLKTDKTVRILDNPHLVNIKQYVNYYVEIMNDVQKCKRANLRKQVKPYYIVATEKNKQTVKSIVDDYSKGEDVVIVDKNLSDGDFDGLKLLSANVEYIVDKLRIEEKACEYDLLTFLGINNNNIEKKERMLSNEVDSNNEFLLLNLGIRFNQRILAVKEINERYGLNVKVSINSDYLSNFIDMEVYNGKIHNRVEED